MCEMTLASQLSRLRGVLWRLRSPRATLLRTDLNSFFQLHELSYPFSSLATFLFYFLSVVDWLPRLLVSPDYYHRPFSLFGFFHLKQGFVWWMSTVHNPPWGITQRKAFTHFPTSAHTECLRKTSGLKHSGNCSPSTPCFQKIKNKEKPSLKHQRTLSWRFNAGHVWLCQWLFCNFVLCV